MLSSMEWRKAAIENEDLIEVIDSMIESKKLMEIELKHSGPGNFGIIYNVMLDEEQKIIDSLDVNGLKWITENCYDFYLKTFCIDSIVKKIDRQFADVMEASTAKH